MAKHVLWLALIALAATGCKKQHPSEVRVDGSGEGVTVPGAMPRNAPPATPQLGPGSAR